MRAGITLQHVIIGARLGAEDVANLLAFLADTRGSNKGQSLKSAMEEFGKLTNSVWKEKDIVITLDSAAGEAADQDQDKQMMSPRGAHAVQQGAAASLLKLACAEGHLEPDEVEELYSEAKVLHSPHALSPWVMLIACRSYRLYVTRGCCLITGSATLDSRACLT